MTIAATNNPLVPADVLDELKARGYKTYVSTEHVLEIGKDGRFLQAIFDNGVYIVASVLHGEDPERTKRDPQKLPEMGEVSKWLLKETAEVA